MKATVSLPAEQTQQQSAPVFFFEIPAASVPVQEPVEKHSITDLDEEIHDRNPFRSAGDFDRQSTEGGDSCSMKRLESAVS